MSKYKMPSTEFLTLIAEDFDNGAIKDAIWEGLRNGELLQAKLDEANEEKLDIIKTKDVIIDQLNQRLTDIGAQC